MLSPEVTHILPYLKPKPVAGLIISHRKPDGSNEMASEDNDMHAMEACAEDLIRAVHAKDAKAVAAALKAAIECADSQQDQSEETNEGQE